MGNITNKIENFEMNIKEALVKTAQELEPNLYFKTVQPLYEVSFSEMDHDFVLASSQPAAYAYRKELGKGDSICFDFGTHCVGYVTLHLKSAGSPPDAPAYIRIKLGEVPCEIGEESSQYQGSISSSWIQEEFLHIDILPAVLRMPRRYAFRYLEIKVVDTSPKYQLVIEKVECDTVTSADRSNIVPLSPKVPEKLRKMDEVSLKTMEDCMQKVFEDGPKRDRRLWIGDLRLQALTNYETFKNNNLVKRCLYLFAGLTQNKGHVGACLFMEPVLQVDDTSLYDYGLFFISCLYDYYMATNDERTLSELWDTAYTQALLAMERVDEDGVVGDSSDWWCFLDWNDDLSKQAGAQGVLIYTLKQAVEIAQILKDEKREAELNAMIRKTVGGAKTHLWDEEKGFFVSGAKRQVSWASQVWLVLAGVFSAEKNRKLLKHLLEVNPKINMVTPYMHHHLVDALIQCDMKNEALSHMNAYWGAMVDDGADCFYELYDPENKNISPYGSRIINSYCHAWSCTPSYFIRKYFAKEYDNDESRD